MVESEKNKKPSCR